MRILMMVNGDYGERVVPHFWCKGSYRSLPFKGQTQSCTSNLNSRASFTRRDAPSS